jgi:hypothetical protein
MMTLSINILCLYREFIYIENLYIENLYIENYKKSYMILDTVFGDFAYIYSI